MLSQDLGANAGAGVFAEAPHQKLEMRQAGLLTAILLLGSIAVAGGNRATVQGPLQEFATAEAMVIPRGQRLLIHSAKALMSEPAAAFIAPSHTAPELIDEGFVFGVADVGLTSSRACRI